MKRPSNQHQEQPSVECKTLTMDYTITINNEQVKYVNPSIYLGALIYKDGGGDKDIQSRLQKGISQSTTIQMRLRVLHWCMVRVHL